jgi:hypothetical protein
MALACQDIYDTTYKSFISLGYTTAEAADAAKEAYSACLQRSGVVSQQTVAVPGGRTVDKGPVAPRSR